MKRRVRLEAAELEEHLTQEKEAKAAQKAEFDKKFVVENCIVIPPPRV